MHSLVLKVDQNLKNHQLVEKGDILLVCVSGGSDSVALLRVLIELLPKWNFQLHVLHFDHGLRSESVEEHHFVESLAESYHLSFHIKISNDLVSNSKGIQAKARGWRLAESQKILSEIRGNSIVTAHHVDDQMETLLLKWLRGCHLSHLQGMSWNAPPYIRPLLNCTKQELSDYLRFKQQSWREDSSNQSSKYLRNRVRNELIPLMNELGRGVLHRRIAAIEEQSSQLQEWLDLSCKTWMTSVALSMEGLNHKNLVKEPKFLQNAILYQYLKLQTGLCLDYPLIAKIIVVVEEQKQVWEQELSEQWVLKIKGEQLFVQKKKEEAGKVCCSEDIQLTHPAHWLVEAKRLEEGMQLPEAGIILYNVAYGSPLALRFRQPGDRFQPFWKAKAVKLKDFLCDQGIPLYQRDRLPLVCREDEVMAIYPRFLAKPFSQNHKKVSPLYLEINLS
ncbi:tRNA lysidine(34) synthetase TilS [Deltaproteobacteria bacterium TL4]